MVHSYELGTKEFANYERKVLCPFWGSSAPMILSIISSLWRRGQLAARPLGSIVMLIGSKENI